MKMDTWESAMFVIYLITSCLQVVILANITHKLRFMPSLKHAIVLNKCSITTGLT